MKTNEENSRQKSIYTSALACFRAAIELKKDNQKINSSTITKYLGKGSRSTANKYARLWHRLEQKEYSDIPQVVLRAYHAAHEGTDTTEKAPYDPPPPAFTDYVQQTTEQVAKQVTQSSWLTVQKIIDSEIEAITLDADRRVGELEDDLFATQKKLEDSYSQNKTLTSELEKSEEVQNTLKHELGKAQGHLSELSEQKQELEKKCLVLEESEKKRLINIAQLETMLESIKNELISLKEQNNKLYHQAQEHSDTITTLTSKASTAEAKVAYLERLIPKQTKE